jgi:membrane fusion protein (multidrug efflux system)
MRPRRKPSSYRTSGGPDSRSARSAKAKSDNSEIELSRTKRLRETGAVAQQELDTAEKNELSDRASVVAGEKQVASLQAGIRYAAAASKSRKPPLPKRKPISQPPGWIFVCGDRRKTRGPRNCKNRGARQLRSRQALMAVVSSDVWVEANYKTQLTQVRPGQEAVVRVDAYPDLELHGHVESIQAGSGAQFSLLPPRMRPETM